MQNLINRYSNLKFEILKSFKADLDLPLVDYSGKHFYRVAGGFQIELGKGDQFIPCRNIDQGINANYILINDGATYYILHLKNEKYD